MKTNHKFMLSLATIAILSGTNAVAAELKVDNGALKLDNETIQVNGSASVAPAEGKEKEAIEVKSTIPSTLGGATMTDLTIKAPQAELKVGGGSAGGSLGGTAPAQDGAASNDGYGFTIDASKVSLNGKDTSNKAELNVNADSSITTSDTAGTSVGANSAINIANGKTLTIKGNLTTSDTSSTISINGGSLNLSGDLTATNGTISLGKDGSLTTNGALNANGGTISLGGGTLTANGKATLSADNNKLDLSQGGTLNFNGAGAENASTISGAVSSAKDKALNINLGRNSQLTFRDSLTLTNASDTALDKISLGGGVLEVKKLIADISNLDTQAGGTINFTGDGSKFTSNPNDTLTLGSGTTFNFKGEQGTEKTTFDNSLTTNGGKLSFNNATMNVKNLTTSANDLLFDSKNGGTIELANGGNSTINGNLTLGDKANIKIISAAGANAKAGTLNVGSLSATKTGNIALGGGTLNVAQGLIIANAGATPDSAGNQSNIDISKGGTINFNGGNSFIGGELKTTKDALLNVKAGNVVFEKLSFGDTTTADSTSKLTLDGGVVNVGALTTTNAANLDLKKGTLNFSGLLDENGEIETQVSTITNLDLSKSEATINFYEGSEVSIGNDLNLATTKAKLNFNSGSLVKLTGSTATLTANDLALNGGAISLKALTSAVSNDDSTARLNFGGASVVLSGTLAGQKDTNSPQQTTDFTFGTDDDNNNFITKSGEKAEISANSTLAFNSGTLNIFGDLKANDATSKLIFGGGILNVGAGGTLSINKAGENLEFKEKLSGILNLAASTTADGKTTKGGAMTITSGDLDLSDTSMNINIGQGAVLNLANDGKIIGSNNAINLSKYATLVIDGAVSGATKIGGTALAETYKITGDLSFDKGTMIGIATTADNTGELKDITLGKLTASDGVNFVFNNRGAVSLTGATASSSHKFNNNGFGDSEFKLADGAVLSFLQGEVDVKGKLSASNQDKSWLKVGSGATANLNKGFDSATLNQIELNNGGVLNVKGDFSGSGLKVSANGGVMNVIGTASITGSTFTIVADEASAGSMLVLTTTKGLTESGNTGEFKVRKSLNDILGKYGLTIDSTETGNLVAGNEKGDKKADIVDSSVTVEVKKS